MKKENCLEIWIYGETTGHKLQTTKNQIKWGCGNKTHSHC